MRDAGGLDTARGCLPPPQWVNVSWDTLFTEVALKLVAFIGVIKGVVSIKLAHVLAMLAATLACEYLVRVAAFVVLKSSTTTALAAAIHCGCSFQFSPNQRIL